jgi:TPR repeat protein
MRASLISRDLRATARPVHSFARYGSFAAFAAGLYVASSTGALALDGSGGCNPPAKASPQTFASAQEALNAAVKEIRAGDPKCSVQALTYAAEGGEPLARWTLGNMYATGDVLPRDEVRAYKYFEQVVDSYNEDDLDNHDIAAISRAFVAVGEYNLSGIPNSEIKPDPERALDMFQFAATNFGDPQAQYELGRMYMEGAAGLTKDKMRAARWFGLAAEKGYAGAQALLGHLLFQGDGVPRQRGRGLMLLSLAKDGANGSKDLWIRDLHAKDYAAASDEDREAGAAYLSSHGMRDLAPLGPPRGTAVVAGSTKPRPSASVPAQ